MSLTLDDPNFSGKVVLVTGAGRGLGRALAVAFAAHGARVAANDLTPVNLDGTVERIAAAGGLVRSYLADVSQSLTAHVLVADIERDWGRLDVLVNNAAVAPQAALISIDEWDWRRTLDVNLSGPLWLLQAAVRLMHAQGRGAVLNLLARPAWLETRRNRAGYQASQWGLIGLTQAAARELAEDQITVNALCVGSLVNREGAQGDDPADEPRGWEEGPGGVPDRVSEVVERALWLCSPAASRLTGQILDIEEGPAEWQARQNPPSPTAS